MTFTNFIKRPVLSTVISIVIVLLGFIGLVSLPIEQYPNIAPPNIVVIASYPGADAETVKNAVVTPLEESINGVEGMDYITSTSSPSSAMIQIMFRQGMNPDMCAVNVQNRVSQATALLPSEVNQIGVRVVKRQSSQVIMFSLTSDGRYDDEFLTNYNAINIIPALKRIEGVGDASSFSEKTYAMRIWLKPDVMKQHNLIPSDITAALAEQNIEAAPGKFGELSDVSYEYSMRYTGRFRTAEEFGNIIIKSDNNGQTLKLKDIAEVELGGQGYSVSMKNNGIPSVMTMVQQVAGSNANEIAKQVKEELESQKKLMPPGMEVKINYDVTEFLYASIEEVVFTLFMTLALVFLVVYIFLQDMRSTLIPLIAVPVSLIGTFFFLNVMGFSINLLVLSALLLAIAIVVDDAIVVVEAVHAKLDQGYKSSLTASIDAMNEISGAIISITLVMAAVFVPVSFIGGTSGTFYREFGVTMAVSIIISALNALTLSPALCAIFLKPHDKEGHEKKLSRVDRFHQSFNVAFDTTVGKYKNLLEKLVRKPLAIIAAVVIGIVVLGITMFTTKTGLVPDEDTGTLFCTISMPPATSQERTKEVVLQVDSILSEIPAIRNREQVLGYNFIAGAGSDMGTFIIKLKSFEERQKGLWWKISGLWEGDGIWRFFINPFESTGVVAQIFIKTAHIKDAQILAFSPPMIPGFSANSGISMVMQDRTGGDLNRFYGIVKDYLAELNKRPEFQMAQTSYNPNYPQYMVHVDVAKCKQAGISPTAVLTTLQGYYGGLYGSNFNSFGKLYRVMIQASPDTRMTPESLNSIFVRTPAGMAPVQEFCNLERVYGPLNINRFNLFTSINITGTVANGYSTGEALKAAQEVADQVLPAGYSYDYQGLTREEAKATNSTAIIFLLCFVFIYLILSAQYESYILPLSVLLSIPFGLAGCFLFTTIFGHANDIYMQISLIMLIGLLAKNAILIVQFALERRETGMAISWSAVLGAAARLRPILMTSLAMVIGLLPMMFASGVGKNGNQTLGAAAIGGMFIGTILQLFVVPTLFVIFQSLQEKFRPMKFEDDENPEVAAELAQYAHSKPVDYELEK
ncbi:MAG: efflux RND transporter permease subunit [Prevotella sp.]|nr:efflux RND transporter permease subunit [Prevotella sp.]MBR1768202.1 efflux RND transporter permease subunit [Prevotella sp.]